LPGPAGQTQRSQIQVPQVASWRLHERFRWPTNQVLVLTCGVVASPAPQPPSTFGIPNPFSMAPSRAEALLFVESKGKSGPLTGGQPGDRNAALPAYHGRY
jgi:hypothetical protein